MPTVEITFDPVAERSLERLPARIGRQVRAAIERIRVTFERGERPNDMRPVYSRNYPNAFRVDSGDYRVLFMVETREGDLFVDVFRVGHRKDVYRGV